MHSSRTAVKTSSCRYGFLRQRSKWILATGRRGQSGRFFRLRDFSPLSIFLSRARACVIVELVRAGVVSVDVFHPWKGGVVVLLCESFRQEHFASLCISGASLPTETEVMEECLSPPNQSWTLSGCRVLKVQPRTVQDIRTWFCKPANINYFLWN